MPIYTARAGTAAGGDNAVIFDSAGNALIGQDTKAASLPVVIASDDDVNLVLGDTTDAAVTSDANGSVSAKLRGLVAILADVWNNASNAVRVLLSEYTAIDTDSGAGTLSALPITWRKTAAGGPEFGTTSDPVIVDPVGTTSQPVRPTRGSLTNRSGTITTGATAQQIAAANASRQYFFIQNLSADYLWINFTTTAVENQPSIRLDPGGSFVQESGFVSTEAVSIIGPTTGGAFTAKEA